MDTEKKQTKNINNIRPFYRDILPELLKLENTPTYLEGKSFAKVVNDPELPFRSEVRAVVRRGPKLGQMVKNENFRYVEWDNGSLGNELYDQKKDPVEYHNLAGDAEYMSIVEGMRKKLYQNE